MRCQLTVVFDVSESDLKRLREKAGDDESLANYVAELLKAAIAAEMQGEKPSPASSRPGKLTILVDVDE